MDSMGSIRSTIWKKVALALALAAALGLPLQVLALCAAQEEDGSWRNVDAQTRGLTRVQIRFVCQDQILNGQPYPPGDPFYFKAWGKCHPSDCEWAEVGGDRLGSGFLHFVVDHGFARRDVYARMSSVYPDRLFLIMWTNFTDPGRPDYMWGGYFEREGS